MWESPAPEATRGFDALSPEAQVLITTGLYFDGASVDEYMAWPKSPRAQTRKLRWRERVVGAAFSWCIAESAAEYPELIGYGAWLDAVMDEAVAA